MRVGTICARNYLASAVLLGESLERVHPDWEFSILLVDIWPEEKERYEQDFPQFRWLAPEDLAIDEAQLGRMKFYYDVIEFSTSLKPWLMEKLLSDADVAMYLDPDIEVFNSLEDLVQIAQRDEIVLLPHVTKPVPRDGLDPKEETFLLSGQFNLGFLCISQQARPFLEYWKERLTSHSVIDHEHGYFTDQRWVDAVPSLFRHQIVRTPGYNVAYWNLHEYELTYVSGRHDDSGVLVDGQPLRFFHYSGHDAEIPLLLSKYAPHPRVSVQDSPVLREILERRSGRLLERNCAKVPYRWNRLTDGRRIANSARQGYGVLVDSLHVAEPPIPFLDREDGAFSSWLVEEAIAGVPNLVLMFWLARGESVADSAFPDGGERQAFFAALSDDQSFLRMATPTILALVFAQAGREVPVRPGFNLVGGYQSVSHVRQLLRQCILGAGIPLWEDGPSFGQRLPIARDFPFSITLHIFEGTAAKAANLGRQSLRGPIDVAVLDHVVDGEYDVLQDRLAEFVEVWTFGEAPAALRSKLNDGLLQIPCDSIASPDSEFDAQSEKYQESCKWIFERFEALMEKNGWKR
jgi:hypothetical protein